MRIHTLTLAACILFSIDIAAQDTATHFHTQLMASKNNVENFYKTGTRLLIKYGSDTSPNKARGILSGASETQIAIKRTRNSNEQTMIQVEDITVLKKVNLKRKIIFAVVGTALVAGGAAAINRGGNTPASAMKGAMVIPVIGVGSYFLCAIPISMLIEKANEKKRKRGWRFFVQ